MSFVEVSGGGVLDRNKKRWVFYTNHVGDKPLFYTQGSKGLFIIGSCLSYVSNALSELSISKKVDEEGCMQQLTYAFMLDNRTIIQNVKRLCAGCCLIVSEGKDLEVVRYHRYEKNINDISEKEAIEVIDSAFKESIRLEYEKDIEYQKKHLVDLSGGLDSRMNYWVADSLGYKDMQCITYSRSEYLDQTIAVNMAADLHHDLIFKPLDDFNFILDIDQIVLMNNGGSIYAGITGGKRLLETIYVSTFGLEHTGQLGDVVIGSYLHESDDSVYHSNNGKYSGLLDYTASDVLIKEYGSYELLLLYTRGFLGVLNTHPIRNHFVEVVSPFINVDFMQTLLNMPEKFRIGHYIYKKWILDCYPEAARYPWESIKARIGEPQWKVLLKRKKSGLARRVRKYSYKIMGKGFASDEGMNPLDYWYNKSFLHRKILDGYFNNNIIKVRKFVSNELYENVNKLYKNGNVIEKTMALTVISSIKQFVL